MSDSITMSELYSWCKVPYDQMENNPVLKIPFRLVSDSIEMCILMARDFSEEIKSNKLCYE